MFKKVSGQSKRFKVECSDCHRQFNFDYRSIHEKKYHGGKRIRLIYLDIPNNPFEIIKKKICLDRGLIPEQDGSVSTEEKSENVVEPQSMAMDIDIAPESSSSHQAEENWLMNESSERCLIDESDSPSISITTVDSDSKIERENEDEVAGRSDEVQVTETSNEKSTMDRENGNSLGLIPINTPTCTNIACQSLDEDMSWITCVAKLRNFTNYFENCRDILQKTDVSVPNPQIFMAESLNFLANIQVESTRLLSYCQAVNEKMMNEHELILQPNTTSVFVEHDPGLRKPIKTANERNYLNRKGPHQPKNIIFPHNTSLPVNKQRLFNQHWYSAYPHLEYSIIKDAAFCFVCSMFPTGPGRSDGGDSHLAWVNTGIRQWHKMRSVGKTKKGKLAQHFNSAAHKAALLDYCHFISDSSSKIDILLNKNSRQLAIKEIQEREFNKEVIKIMTDIARTLGKQGLPFQGHLKGDHDGGNFSEIVRLMARHNPTMNRWLTEKCFRRYQTTYMSWESQNEFIHLLGSEVRRSIVEEIDNAEMFSVIADTTPDLSHKDMLTVVIRYVNKHGIPTERLIKIVEAQDKTGVGLATKIYEVLMSCRLNVDRLFFQSYDFAENMKGIHKGTQAELSKILGRKIHYIPCQAHRLNTFVEHASNQSSVIRDFFDVTQSLYVFFSGSTKRFQYLQEKLEFVENSLQLRNLSQTRWTARAESVKAISASYEIIIEVLDEIKDSPKFDKKTRSSASGLLKKVRHFDYIAALYFLKNIMFKLKALTQCLEAENLNIVDTAKILSSTINILQTINSTEEDCFDNLLEGAINFARTLQIDPVYDYESHHRIRYRSHKIDDAPKTEVLLDLKTFYRKQYRELLDSLLTEMRDNLTNLIKTAGPMMDLFHFPISKSSNEDIQGKVKKIMEMAPEIFSNCDFECISAEIELLLDQSQTATSLEDIMAKAEDLKTALNQANILLRFILTAPVSVASGERRFSRLKFVKGPLRSTMTDVRTDALMMMTCEDDICSSINTDRICDEWLKMRHRRINF